MGKAELICAAQNSDSSACKRGELRHSTDTSGSLKKAGSQHYAKLIRRKQSPLGTAVIKFQNFLNTVIRTQHKGLTQTPTQHKSEPFQRDVTAKEGTGNGAEGQWFLSHFLLQNFLLLIFYYFFVLVVVFPEF